MSFEEDVLAVIQKGKSDKAQYEKETRDFESEWYSLRDGLLNNLFQESANAFNKEGYDTKRDRINGYIVFHTTADRFKELYQHELKFSALTASRIVICSSDLFTESESFTLDHLKESNIQRKIKEFADLVARDGTPTPKK